MERLTTDKKKNTTNLAIFVVNSSLVFGYVPFFQVPILFEELVLWV